MEFLARMQFEDSPFVDPIHPTLPQPGHYGTGGFSSLDSFYPAHPAETNVGRDDDADLQRILALSAATNREQRVQDEFVRSTAFDFPNPAIPPPPRPAPPAAPPAPRRVSRRRGPIRRASLMAAAGKRPAHPGPARWVAARPGPARPGPMACRLGAGQAELGAGLQ
jgi:hypothetical protein